MMFFLALTEGLFGSFPGRIAWDGGWHDGAQEMRGHLAIEELQTADS